MQTHQTQIQYKGNKQQHAININIMPNNLSNQHTKNKTENAKKKNNAP